MDLRIQLLTEELAISSTGREAHGLLVCLLNITNSQVQSPHLQSSVGAASGVKNFTRAMYADHLWSAPSFKNSWLPPN